MGARMQGRVLSVASECVPLVKTGGLADVVGALPGALAGQGWDMRVLLPAYRSLRGMAADWPEVWVEDGGPAGGGFWRARWPGFRCCCWTRRISMTAKAGPMWGQPGIGRTIRSVLPR